MSRFKLSLLVLVIGTCYLEVSGQAARTPFSAFGYGDSYGDALIHHQGMGGVGVSNPQFWHLNTMNPALLTNNRLTVFQAGVVIDKRRIYSGSLKENSSGGNLNYLAMGFPLMRNKQTGETRWGTAIGLNPYSNVNFSYEYESQTNGTDVIYFDKSLGGLSEFYWSNGVRLNRHLSLGLKTSFLFGSLSSDFSSLLDNPDQAQKRITNVHEFQSMKGVRFIPGVHFKKDSVFNKYSFNLGFVAELKAGLNTNLEQVLEVKNFSTGSILLSDTLSVSTNRAYLPQRYSAGLSFGNSEKWMLAADFSLLRPNGKFVVLGLDSVAATNGWRVNAGAELTPDARSLGSYLKRITYRTGISAESGTYLVNGNAVKDFGINFGFSFPVNRISSLDVAFRTGKRGDLKLNGIEENYFKIYFGVTFNDTQWFIKRRFD
jgi:hypothetical protein